MKVTLRPGTRDDTKECGRIDYEAFAAIGKQHNFPPDFPNVDVATMVVSMLLTTPGYYSVVAELDGKVVGSNFLDERGPIAGIGPISVDPTVQNRTIGRQLMLNVMERAKTRCPAGVRLVQSGYHNRSLCLYTKLGFETREPLSIMQGKVPASGAPRDREVRLATD